MVPRAHFWLRWCGLALCLVVSVSLLCPQFPAAAYTLHDRADWTFMVYMAADNNLEGPGIDDFIEMSAAGSDSNLNIVVQFDRIPGYDARFDNWTSTKRFLVAPGMTPTAANALMDIGEANMGDPQTVIDFVNWARAAYPAGHYALIFWNHGGGWLSDLYPEALRHELGGSGVEDFCWDNSNGGDAITSAELFQALDTTTGGGTLPIDQVGFDACLMAMWEVDNQIRPFGSLVTISSEENEPLDGWPYNTILADLKANPAWTPAQLGYAIVERYYESYGNDQTQSAKDLAAAYTGLNQAVDAFAQALIAYEPTYHGQYDTARSAAQSFGSSFIDLYDLAFRIYSDIGNAELDAAALAVMNAVDAAVIHERHGASWPGAHGIDLYFPASLSDWTAYQQLRSSSITHWDEFVEYHVTGTLPCAEAFVAGVDYTADGLTVTVTPDAYGDAPLDYLWTFGDGTTSTEPSPVHTYPVSGTYDITLDLTNCSGTGHATWEGSVSLSASIVVDPLSLEALLAPGTSTTLTLWVTNTGVFDLEWEVHELTRPLSLAPLMTPDLRPRADPVVDAPLADDVRSGGRARAIIYLRELPDLAQAYRIADREARRLFVSERLQATVEKSGGALFASLRAAGAEPRALPLVNAIAATLDAGLLRDVAARPEVAHIRPDRAGQVFPSRPGQPRAAATTVEWNIAKIRADQAWTELGVTGEGAVIGIIDTGVAYLHPALVDHYRGNLGGGSFDHNYNWFDFVAGQPVPYDDNGHGTFGIGIAIGDDGGGYQIGVAPGAKWIAAKACTGGGMCSQEDLLAAAFWMLAPYRLDGTDPNPAMAPDIVFNGWGWGNQCDPWFEVALSAWRAAGILGVFIPGGEGPGCATTASPANSSLAVCAGATDVNDNISPFSARGPSPCTGAIKPEVVAPGVNIRSSVPGGGYDVWSGTTMSAAHLAGAAALTWSANPDLEIATLTQIITSTTLCRYEGLCGGTPCPGGANNSYGWGRIDAYEAVSLALSLEPSALPWLAEVPVSGTLAPGESEAVTVEFDAGDLAPGLYRGLLDVESNDPESPHVGVPVTLTVELPCQPVDAGSVSVETDGCTATLSLEVTGTAPVTYEWDFGPFGTSDEPSPTVNFQQSGAYPGSVEVWNCDGAGHDEQSFTVEVSCVPPCREAEILYVDTEAQECIVTFTPEVTGTPSLAYTWNFGPFGLSTEPEPVVNFWHTGAYSWTLAISNCGGAGYDTYSQVAEVTCNWRVYVPIVIKGQ